MPKTYPIMEEEAEKMATLKRAYADIILNAAKESAARVLVAERRALAFQKSLFAAKDEALATILRLRAIMEAKIRESEKAALCRSKKIEELELQLGEAEDTIIDLREELKRLREELIMMKDGSIHQSSDQHRNDVCTLYNNIGTEASSDTLDEPQDMSTVSYMTTRSQKTSEVDFAGNEVLASIIWRSKEPELYRNGCTQRIRALEHNLLTSKGPFGEINGFRLFSKKEPLTCTNEKLVIASKVDSEKSDKTAILSKDNMKFEETVQQTGCCETTESGQAPGCCGDDHVKFLSRVSPTKQRTIFNQTNTFSSDIYSDKSMSYSNNFNFIIPDNQKEGAAPKEPSAPFMVPIGVDETSEDRITDAGTSIDEGNLILNQCSLDTSIDQETMWIKQCSKRITRQCVIKQSQSDCENEILNNSMQNSEDVNKRITMNDPLLSNTFSMNNNHPFSGGIQKDSRDKMEVHIPSREKAENVEESSDNSIMKPEMGVSLLRPDNKNEENGTSHTGTDKFLKYTFHRKRKRGCCPINNDIVFPEKKTTLKTKSVDKQYSLGKPSKSSVATDSPRNNRQLVQVARQDAA